MSFVKVKRFPGRKGEPARTYYYEVESYRDQNDKVKHRTIRYLGKELPKDLSYVVGYDGVKLHEGKRVEVRATSLGALDFLNETGTIRKLRRKYAHVEFDKPIRGSRNWSIRFDQLGNLRGADETLHI